MFAADIVIIFIVFIGVSHCCCNRFVPLDTDGIVLPHNVFIAICYSILNNFYHSFSQSHLYTLTM
ncbi:hypothetical protein MMM7_05570 [Helicobacter pylori]